MFEANRRIILQSFAVGAGALATSPSFAAGSDGHAAGYDVSAASEYLKTIPRKSGDPVVFTASLDKGALKATSGGDSPPFNKWDLARKRPRGLNARG